MNMKYGYSCLAVVKPNILLFLHRFNGFMGTSVSHIQVLIVVTMWYLKRITVLTTLQSHEHRNAGFTPEKCEGKHLCWKMVPHIKAPRRSWEQRCICFFFFNQHKHEDHLSNSMLYMQKRGRLMQTCRYMNVFI